MCVLMHSLHERVQTRFIRRFGARRFGHNTLPLENLCSFGSTYGFGRKPQQNRPLVHVDNIDRKRRSVSGGTDLQRRFFDRFILQLSYVYYEVCTKVRHENSSILHECEVQRCDGYAGVVQVDECPRVRFLLRRHCGCAEIVPSRSELHGAGFCV